MVPKRRREEDDGGYNNRWEEKRDDDQHQHHHHDHGAQGSNLPSPKRFRNAAVRDFLGKQSMSDFASSMEPFLRSVIRDEVEKAFHRGQPSSWRGDGGSNSRGKSSSSSSGGGLILHFVNKLPSTIFTNSRIEAEDGNPLRIVLLDSATNTIVTTGPLSSLKLDILVLDGDFGSNDCDDDWSPTEFNTNVIKEREGRRPLIAGELSIVLKDGVAHISDVLFTDNSSWQRSRKFRLGVKAATLSKTNNNNNNDNSTPASATSSSRIREARSEAFIVKDHRGELYKKHYPPKLGDEVWRLERIAKEGAFHKRLSSNGIRTVKEFLIAYVLDPAALRSILGGGISNRIWECIIEHANTCVLDETKLYVYTTTTTTSDHHHHHGQGQGQGIVKLLFNSVYKLVAAMFEDGQTYQPLDKLTPPQKGGLEKLKREAYRNQKEMVQMDSRSVLGPSSQPFHLPDPTSSNVGELEFQNLQAQLQLSLPLHHHHQYNINNNNASSSYHLVSPNVLKTPSSCFNLDNINVNGWGSSSWPTLLTTTTMSTNDNDNEDDNNNYNNNNNNNSNNVNSSGMNMNMMMMTPTPTPTPTPIQIPMSPALLFPSAEEMAAMLSSFDPDEEVHGGGPGSPRGRWCKIRSALKLRSMLLARRTRWHSFPAFLF